VNALSASRDDVLDLVMLFGGGLVIGVGSIVFRETIPPVGLPGSLYQLQYTLAFLFVGALVLLQRHSNKPINTISMTVLILGLGIGLVNPVPQTDQLGIVANVGYMVAVIALGHLHYRFNSPKNTLLVGVVFLFGLEFYLFGLAYLVSAFERTSGPLVVFAGVVLTVMFVGYRRILGKELAKTSDDSGLADVLRKLL